LDIVANKRVESVLEKMKGTYSKALVDVDKREIKRLLLDSPSLNFIFGGSGFAMGRIYEFYGPESGGKSTLATYIAGQVQRYYERPMVLYVDIERSFDKKYASTLGLDISDEKFILIEPLTGEEGFEITKALIQELPIGLIIWDSLAATPSHGQMEDAFKSSYGGTAGVFAEGLKTLNPYIHRLNTSMIVINQERANVGKMPGRGPDTKTTGGYAIKFYASWRGRITKIDTIKDKSVAVGIVSKVRNIKNKAGVPYREAELNLIFDKGFDSFNEYIKFMVDLGVITQGGAWYNQADLGIHVKGKEGLAELLANDSALFDTLRAQVDELMRGSTAIDVAEPPEDVDLDEEEEFDEE